MRKLLLRSWLLLGYGVVGCGVAPPYEVSIIAQSIDGGGALPVAAGADGTPMITLRVGDSVKLSAVGSFSLGNQQFAWGTNYQDRSAVGSTFTPNFLEAGTFEVRLIALDAAAPHLFWTVDLLSSPLFSSGALAKMIIKVEAPTTPSPAPPPPPPPPPVRYTLVINNTAGGSAVASPVADTYAAGAEVILTATSSAGYQFIGWTGDLVSAVNPITIAVTGNKTVTAVFVLVPPPPPPPPTRYRLTIITTGSGVVGLDPSGGEYDEGTTVTLRASPEIGYRFVDWGGNLSGSTNPTMITMNSDKTVEASFERLPPPPPPPPPPLPTIDVMVNGSDGPLTVTTAAGTTAVDVDVSWETGGAANATGQSAWSGNKDVSPGVHHQSLLLPARDQPWIVRLVASGPGGEAVDEVAVTVNPFPTPPPPPSGAIVSPANGSHFHLSEVDGVNDDGAALTAQVSGGTAPYSFHWLFDGTNVATSQTTITHKFLFAIQNGSVYMQVQDGAGLLSPVTQVTIWVDP